MNSSNQKPQKLVVHTHDKEKLFHVSIHNYDTKTDYTWKGVAGKAKYVYDKLLSGKRDDSSERTLTGGLHIAMINTNYDGWATKEYPGNYPLAQALTYKDDLIEEYEDLGYSNVGVRTMISKRDPSNDGLGSRWSSKFKVEVMTKNKIFEKIEFINASLKMNIPDGVRNSAYLSMVRADGKIDNMATLLLYIRQKMGLT